jgi:hypothetical protein
LQWLLVAGLLAGCSVSSAYEAQSSRGVDFSGFWKINNALSDDAEAILQARIEKELKERERWARKARESSRLGLPPLGEELPPNAQDSSGAPTPRRQRSARSRRDDDLRRMLGFTQSLDITQTGSRLNIVTDMETRSFTAGSNSQVSTAEGELADSQVGWDGEWFISDRRVHRGARIVEKYRLLKKTGQLEYQINWGGDHMLSGIKIRRVFDRAEKDTTPPDPDVGPIR